MAVCSCGFQPQTLAKRQDADSRPQTLAKRQDAASTNDILSTSIGLDSNYRAKH